MIIELTAKGAALRKSAHDAKRTWLAGDAVQGRRDYQAAGTVVTVYPAQEIIDRSAQLARAFRERGLPVVLVDAHRYSVEKIFPRRGETATTSTVLKLLHEG